MSDWYEGGLEDDMREHMFALRRAQEPFALATIAAADSGPRPVGAQMVVTDNICRGFLSGGCIEADVALHGREVLRDGEPRRLVYGNGSPFIDMPLPCGGRLEVLIERVPGDDDAVSILEEHTQLRRQALWSSDGRTRWCTGISETHRNADALATRTYDPAQRLAVIGSDPFALAIAGIGATLGWDAVLVRPFGPETPPSFRIGYCRLPVDRALAELAPDHWTAVVIATHDLDLDHAAVISALGTDAGYVGVMGARRRLPERFARLRASGVDEQALARIHSPVGLPLGAATPWEVAISVAGEIIGCARGTAPEEREPRCLAGTEWAVQNCPSPDHAAS